MSEPMDVPMLGRARELARLTEVLARAKAGRLAVAWIEGEAGIGKSRLLSEAVEIARREGFGVHAGTAYELERSRPFGSLLDAFEIGPKSGDQRRSTINTLIAGGPDRAEGRAAPGSTVDPEHQVIELFLTLFEETAVRGPFLVALDDFHWADPSTIDAVHTIIRRMHHLPVIIVAAFRPLPRSAELEALFRTTEVAFDLRLEPLDASSVAGLAENILSAVPGKSLLDQVGEAAGNPLFVIELLHALRDERAIEVTNGIAEAHAAPRPPTLRLTILRRIGFLAAETLEVLRVASVLGSTFSASELARMLGRAVTEIVTPIQDAARAGVLIDEGGSLTFRHDLIREAIYEDLSLGVRAGMHLDTARMLEAAGASALRVAEHIARGASPGDRGAIERLRDLAEASVIVAPAAAVRLLERALELLSPTDPLRMQVAAALVMPLYLTGRISEADAIVREVLAGSPRPATEYVVRRSRAYSLVIRGHVAEAVAEYLLVVKNPASARGESAETNHAVDLVNLGLALLNSGDTREAQRHAEAALVLAENARSAFATALALLTLANIADAEGRVGDALDLVDRGMTIVDDKPHTANYWAHWAVGLILVGADRLAEAETAIRTGLRLVEDEGRISQVSLYQLALQLILMHTGRWDDSLTSFEAASTMPDKASTPVARIYGRAMAAYLSVHQGRLDVAAQLVDEAEADLAQTGLASGGQLFVAMCRSLLLESGGKTDEAHAVLAAAWNAGASTRWSCFAEWRTVAPVLVHLSVATGDLATARSVTEEVEEAARQAAGSTTAAAAAMRCRGLLENDALILLKAVEVLRSGPRPIDRALAAEDAAVALAATGRLDDARPLLEESLAVYEQVGAARDIARTMQILRRFGVRKGSRRPRGRPTSGWDSLTPTEQQVVSLLAKGLANVEIAKQLYISRYTVETHLKHVYAKLGIASRTELAVEAARRDAARSASE